MGIVQEGIGLGIDREIVQEERIGKGIDPVEGIGLEERTGQEEVDLENQNQA